MPATKKPKSKLVAKELIIKALTDPKFRLALTKRPGPTLGIKELTPSKKKEIAKILRKVKEIDARIASLADELLCANGGCGIA